jgi:murein L,D-transpeptidase YcbB/YkuD
MRMWPPVPAPMLSAVMKIPDVRQLLISAVLVLSGPSTAGTPLIWVQNGQLTSQGQQVVGALRHVEDFGLASRDFASLLAAIDAQGGNPVDSTRLDDLMSAAALRLINQLHYGRIDPRAAGYALNRARTPLDSDAALRQLAAAPNALEALQTFEPRSSQYRALEQTLARYRRIRTDLRSLPTPGVVSLKPGDFYAGAEQLRALLTEVGDAIAPRNDAGSESIYDTDLAEAVARFQRRHGLEPDGVLGHRTLDALTVPVPQRIRQIELTMERWRWLPDIKPPAVIVNLPQYMLYALQDPLDSAAGARPLKIPVIVGQTARQTPIFDSAIESVIFRPYWNVPGSIVRKELLPLIERDSGYLARQDLEIVRGDGDDAEVLAPDDASVAALRTGAARLRQRPGPNNALGLIKFVLPNPYSVYLHSTPEAYLFGRERRAFSHGCIRVSDASALAAYLLKDTPGDWNADAIEAATCLDKSLTVHLATPVPVFILYGTVVIDSDGQALFFDDLYGYDRRLDALLSAGSGAS